MKIQPANNGITASLLLQAYDLLNQINIKWAFCGGYSFDLFLNAETKKHSDIDICVFEQDRSTIKDFMLSSGWNIYQFLGQGKVRPMHKDDSCDPGRNFMCVKDGCSLVKFYPCEESGVMLHEFYHTGIERLDYLEFLFNRKDCGEGNKFIFSAEPYIARDMQKAILYNGPLPYLAPELALLYKAPQAQQYSQTYPPNCEQFMNEQLIYDSLINRMDKEQFTWFQESIAKLYPNAHPWKKENYK